MIDLKNKLVLSTFVVSILSTQSYVLCFQDQVGFLFPDGQTIIVRPTSPETTGLIQRIYQTCGVADMVKDINFFTSEDQTMVRAELQPNDVLQVNHGGYTTYHGKGLLGKYIILSPLLKQLIQMIQVDDNGSPRVPLFLVFELLNTLGKSMSPEEDVNNPEWEDSNNYRANKFAVEKLSSRALQEFQSNMDKNFWAALGSSAVPELIKAEIEKRLSATTTQFQ